MRKVQCVSESEALVECVERYQNRVAIFECDVLNARQCMQCAIDILGGDFVEASYDPRQFEQHGQRDKRSFGKRYDSRCPLVGSVCIVGIIDEDPDQIVRVQGPHELPRRERVSSAAATPCWFLD